MTLQFLKPCSSAAGVELILRVGSSEVIFCFLLLYESKRFIVLSPCCKFVCRKAVKGQVRFDTCGHCRQVWAAALLPCDPWDHGPWESTYLMHFLICSTLEKPLGFCLFQVDFEYYFLFLKYNFNKNVCVNLGLIWKRMNIPKRWKFIWTDRSVMTITFWYFLILLLPRKQFSFVSNWETRIALVNV